MISSAGRERSGTVIGSTRLRMTISPEPVSMRARCGASASVMIHAKISGNASQNEFTDGKDGQLVTEHVVPHRFEIDAVIRECLDCGHCNGLVGAFLFKNIPKDDGRRSAIAMPVEVHYVIEITRPGSFAERPQLLAESFLVGVGGDPHAASGAIAVRMKYFAPHGRQDELFIRRQIKLDLRPAAARR